MHSKILNIKRIIETTRRLFVIISLRGEGRQQLSYVIDINLNHIKVVKVRAPCTHEKKL